LAAYSKTAAYDAARKGLIPVIEQGRKKPVPTAWLRQVLGLKQRKARKRASAITAPTIPAE
jgi:hypothetical protein